jgi:N-acetylneuraminate synthase
VKRLEYDPNRIIVCAEIGINHNGSLEVAKELIEQSANVGCDYVKFQKRTPEICVPDEMRDVIRQGTPWGDISYMDYRKMVEFGKPEYDEIDAFCKKLGIGWTASPWDEPSVEFLMKYKVPFLKIASASITDRRLIEYCAQTNIPLVVSTGMADLNTIRKVVTSIYDAGGEIVYLLHTTSTYPAPVEELNLKAIHTLTNEFASINIGYSGHERGIPSTVLAIGLGAKFIERHVTLDRTMWGSDQAASLEIEGLRRVVQAARTYEAAIGDGVIKVNEGEKPLISRLRRVVSL